MGLLLFHKQVRYSGKPTGIYYTESLPPDYDTPNKEGSKQVASQLYSRYMQNKKKKIGQLYTIHPAGELVSEKKVNVFAYINKDEKRVSSFSTFYCFYVTGMKEELLEKYLYQKIR